MNYEQFEDSLVSFISELENLENEYRTSDAIKKDFNKKLKLRAEIVKNYYTNLKIRAIVMDKEGLKRLRVIDDKLNRNYSFSAFNRPTLRKMIKRFKLIHDSLK